MEEEEKGEVIKRSAPVSVLGVGGLVCGEDGQEREVKIKNKGETVWQNKEDLVDGQATCVLTFHLLLFPTGSDINSTLGMYHFKLCLSMSNKVY